MTFIHSSLSVCVCVQVLGKLVFSLDDLHAGCSEWVPGVLIQNFENVFNVLRNYCMCPVWSFNIV